MITKINIYNLLILLTLISFAFFGSLSHLFSLGLIMLSVSIWLSTEKSNWLDLKTVGLFLALTGCVLFFLIDSLVKKSIGHHLTSLGPILPIPIIGLLILFQAGEAGKDFDLTAEKITKYSHSAIFITLFVYLLISVLVGSDPIFDQLQTTRVELLSGNPIPFSYVVQGISIFCLANWRKSHFKNKILAFSFFVIGTVFSSFLSGTRGTLLSLLVISPILFFYLCESIRLTLLACVVSGLTGVLFIQTGFFLFNNNIYFNSLTNGIDTLILSNNSDSSISHRLQMWIASIKAISNVPMFGYGIENKFQAIKPYLSTSVTSTYTHPHNDIFASIIAVGFLGGIAALISLTSGFLAAFLTPNWSIEKVFLSLMVSIPTLITANLSTVFFNDISAAWLAFSTYLIWKLDFKNKKTSGP